MERVVLPRDLAACCVRQFQFAPILLGYPVIGIWFWYCDQTIVQRVLAAKDDKYASLGALFCAFLKIWPVFLFVLSGVMCVALVQRGHLAEPHPSNGGGRSFCYFKKPDVRDFEPNYFLWLLKRKGAQAHLRLFARAPFSVFTNVDSGHVQAHGNIAEGDRVRRQELVGREP
jgi:hypothetical protein